jgi:uncharacterized protein YbjT (DUF2867 family)
MPGLVANVAVVGASGNLGTKIINAFLNSGDFNVTAISRESSNATFPHGVKVIKTDLSSQDALTKAFEGQDAVVLSITPAQLGEQKHYIDAAVTAGVKRFIPADFGSDISDPKVVEAVPFYKPKAEIQAYLESKASDTFSWTTIANGVFFDWGLNTGFLGFDLKNKTARIFDYGDAPFSTSTLSLVGETVVKVLSAEFLEDTKNKVVYVESRTVTQNEILAGLQKLTGKDTKWKVEKIETKKVSEDSWAKIKAGEGGIEPHYELLKVNALRLEHSKKSWNGRLELSNENLESDLKAALNRQ